MTYNKLKNLAGFCTTLHREWVGNELMLNDKSYILEKYSKFIGAPIRESNVIHRKEINVWLDRWDVEKSLYPTIIPLLNFLFSVNDKALHETNPQIIVDLFTEYIGDPEEINEEIYTHLHAFLKDHVSRYFEKYPRELNLILILS